MDRYKPEYLGKVIPAEDTSKLGEFAANAFDAFTSIYDVCKEHSSMIDDIKRVNEADAKLSVKIVTDLNTLDLIKSDAKSRENIQISGDVITAT